MSQRVPVPAIPAEDLRVAVEACRETATRLRENAAHTRWSQLDRRGKEPEEYDRLIAGVADDDFDAAGKRYRLRKGKAEAAVEVARLAAAVENNEARADRLTAAADAIESAIAEADRR